MTHYFIDFGHSTATKNKPQHEAHDYLRSLHGTLIVKEDLTAFQNIVQARIKSISANYPRCKPIEVEFQNRAHSNNSIWMKGFEAVVFKFEPATLVLTENLTENATS